MAKFKYRSLCIQINAIALRKAKIEYNFGLSECNRVNNATLMAVFWDIAHLKHSFVDRVYIVPLNFSNNED